MLDIFSPLLYILWDVNPEIPFISQLTGGYLAPRWYGLLFASGFFFGNYLFVWIYKIENKPEPDLEKLFIYIVISTVLGARLGHCLFYQPDYFLDPKHFVEILYVWEGGLASHGAAIAIPIAVYLFSRRRPTQPFLWVSDRLMIAIAFGGSLIRFGNLLNSEIIGKATNLPWGFQFVRALGISDPNTPRHPAQLYEAIFYMLVFFLLFYIYYKNREKTPRGMLTSIFLIAVFGFRFFVEFIKENQVSFESNLTLNMGQMLSIPVVIAGFVALYYSQKNGNRY